MAASSISLIRMADSASSTALLLYALGAVVGVILLVARFKLHPFVALTLASIALGLCSGMSWGKVAQVFQEGIGAMLGSVAVVVGLGMIIGKLLAESGGAQVIASKFIQALGERRLDWTMLIVGFVVGIPVFFTVGVVLLVPILFSLRRASNRPLLLLGIPMLAGLSVAHGLVPPHPGPMAAIGIVNADPGKTIWYSIVIGFPAAILAGPVLGRFLSSRVVVASPPALEQAAPAENRKVPGFSLSLFTILLPVGLMLLATLAALIWPDGSPIRAWAGLIGSPAVAMLIATLFALFSFGTFQGASRAQILKWTEESLAPAGSILLVVGAGGGFNRILVASGVGDVLASWAQSTSLSPLTLGWLVAALIRVATGSATVAITTAMGVVAPFAASVPGTNMELLVIATGAGSLILSHVNDGGFWFVKEYLGLTVTQTLQTWTVMETVISILVLGLVLIVNAL